MAKCAAVGIRWLSLVKGEHRFVIRYTVELETDVIDALASLASDPASGFGWLDAVKLSYQMARGFEVELNQLPS